MHNAQYDSIMVLQCSLWMAQLVSYWSVRVGDVYVY